MHPLEGLETEVPALRMTIHSHSSLWEGWKGFCDECSHVSLSFSVSSLIL